MKRYLCGHWRVLFLEGEPCTVVVVDVYKPGGGGELLLEGEDVKLLGERKGSLEVQALRTVDEETIFVKFCEKDVKKPEEYLKKAFELLSLEPPNVECVEESGDL